MTYAICIKIYSSYILIYTVYAYKYKHKYTMLFYSDISSYTILYSCIHSAIRIYENDCIQGPLRQWKLYYYIYIYIGDFNLAWAKDSLLKYLDPLG